MQNCGVRLRGCDVPAVAAPALAPITAGGDDGNANRIALERGTSDSSSPDGRDPVSFSEAER